MATFTQFVSDDTTPNDSISKGPYKPLIDSPGLADSITKGTARSLADSSPSTDSIVKNAIKNFVGAISCSDNIPSRIIGRGLAEVASITDSVSRHWVLARSYSDTASVADSLSKNPIKAAFVEARIVLSDSIGRLMNKVVSELLSLADKLIWPSNPRIMGAISTALRFIGEIIVGD